MSLPVATARLPRAPTPLIQYAVLVAALVAFGTAFLPMVDYEVLYYCGCEETFRLAQLHGGAPELLVAVFTLARIITGHRGGVVRRMLEAMTVFLLVLSLMLVFAGWHRGAEFLATALSHATLLGLLALRALMPVLRRVREIWRQ